MEAGAIGEAERIVLCRPSPERRIDFFLTVLLAKFTEVLRPAGSTGGKPDFHIKPYIQSMLVEEIAGLNFRERRSFLVLPQPAMGRQIQD